MVICIFLEISILQNSAPPLVMFHERGNCDDIQDNEFKMAIINTFKALKEDENQFQNEDLENTNLNEIRQGRKWDLIKEFLKETQINRGQIKNKLEKYVLPALQN